MDICSSLIQLLKRPHLYADRQVLLMHKAWLIVSHQSRVSTGLIQQADINIPPSHGPRLMAITDVATTDMHVSYD